MKKFGHYEVTAELGRGGMGVVYKGFEPSLNRKVAIKALGEHLLNDEGLVERFTREAKATAALNDPNVIQIYYIGKEQGQPYFAMEYIEGLSLDDLLKGNRCLTIKHAKNILKQACQGLAAAHKINLVHRDIKPANMMLTNTGTLKVVDFGIAQTREYGDKLTNTGEFVGTPGYLSPEVCIGKDVDQRSDIFALGIVFYEMLAGKVPFENDSPLGLMLEVVQSDIPDIRQLNKKVDKKSAFILQKMIAKSPDDRYQNCEEIIRDLGNVIDNQPMMAIKDSAQTINPSTMVKDDLSNQATIPSIAAVTVNNLVPQQQSKSSKKWLAVAVVFALIGSVTFSYMQGYITLPTSHTNTAQQTAAVTNFADGGTMQASLFETKGDNKTSSDTSMAAHQQATTDDTLVNSMAKKDTLAMLNTDIPTTQARQLISDSIISDSDATTQIGQNLHNKVQQMSQELGNQSAVELPTTLNTVAHQNVQQSDKLASAALMAESTSSMAQDMNQQIIEKAQPIAQRKLPVLNKGVVIMAFGDPAIANPVEKILEGELEAQGIKVMNEQFIPGMRQLLNNDLDLAAVKNLIEKNGGQAMVIANVNYVGTQELQYAGRFSELISAQLDIDTYDIKTGDNIGEGFGAKISYTSLNATDQASDIVMQFTDQLTTDLKPEI